MAETISRDVAIAFRHHLVTRKGTPLWHTHYIGRDFTKGASGEAAPTNIAEPVAYLIEQDPYSIVPAHFHGVDQFQVVIAGDGLLGGRPLAPLCVHYTNGFTSYGPLDAGAEGLAYFTLRNRRDGPAYFLPDARDVLRTRRSEGREVIAHGDLSLSRENAHRLTSLIALGADGLSAALHALAPRETMVGLDPSSGAGQYWLILEGELRTASGTQLPPLSCIYVDAEEALYAGTAGLRGAKLVVLQFPRRAVN